MSTPDRVIDEPYLEVLLPALGAHQVALLVRGLDARVEVLRNLRDLGVMGPAGYAERAEPAQGARIHLARALAAWCRDQGYLRVKDDDTLPGLWPEGPVVDGVRLNLAELWQVRLAADNAFMGELERLVTRAGRGASDADHAFFAPLADAHRAVLAALESYGVDGE